MSPPWKRCFRIGWSRNSRIGALQYQQSPKTTAYARAALNSLDRSSSRCSRKLMEPLGVAWLSVMGRGGRVSSRGGGRGDGQLRGLPHDRLGLLAGFLQGRADALDFLELLHLDFPLEGGSEFVRGLAEFGHAASQHPSDLGKLPGAEQEERQHENEDDFLPAEGSEHREQAT